MSSSGYRAGSGLTTAQPSRLHSAPFDSGSEEERHLPSAPVDARIPPDESEREARRLPEHVLVTRSDGSGVQRRERDRGDERRERGQDRAPVLVSADREDGF